MNTSMNALFEAQADFERIERMIAQKFGIPDDAKILCGLHAPTAEESKYARGESELKEKYMVKQDYIDILCTGDYDSNAKEFRYKVDDAKFAEVIEAVIRDVPHAVELARDNIALERARNLLTEHFHMDEEELRKLMGYDADSLPEKYSADSPLVPVIRRLITAANRVSRLVMESTPTEIAGGNRMMYASLLLFSSQFVEACSELSDADTGVFAVSDEQVEECLANAGTRAEQIVKYLEILRSAYKSIAEQKAERKLKAAEFLEHPGPHCFVENDVLRNLPDNSTWDIIPLTNYIRVWAIQYMTYDDFFGIGNSGNAAAVISKGMMAEFNDDAINVGRSIWEHLDRPSTLPEPFRDYIALQEKRFLPGILRIAFDELGLMDFMAGQLEVIDNVFAFMGLDVGTPSDTIRLKHFGKVVLPKFTMMAIVAQPSPTAIYSKSELEKGDRYFGDELSHALKDTIDNLDFVPDANLSRGKGGQPLSYDDMLETVDDVDANEKEYVKEATRNVAGKPYVADIGDTENVPAVESATQLSVTTDDPDECPAYKTGDWYVVYVRQEKASRNDRDYKSARGWFAFDGPGNVDGRFYLNADYSKGKTENFGVSNWCIVYSPSTYWSHYVNVDGNGYAYFLINQNAYVSNSPTTAYGCTFDAVDADEENGYEHCPNFAGMMRNRQCFMDRSNNYAMSSYLTGPNASTAELITTPSNMLTPTSALYRSANMSIILLSIIGKWDTNVSGEENILNRVKELTNQWIPVCGGKMIETSHGMNSIHASDVTSIEKILTSLSRNDESAFMNIINGGATIRYREKEWVRRKFSDEYDLTPDDLNQHGVKFMMFVPYENTRTGETIDEHTPALLFSYDIEHGVTAVTPRPTTVINCNDVVRGDNWRGTKDSKAVPYRPEDSNIKWMNSGKGASARRRVGIGDDDGMYICGPDTDNEPRKIADSWGQVPSASHKFTYISTEDGYNIVLTDNDFRPYLGGISFVGYVRRGRVRWMGIDAIGSNGNAVMHDITVPRDARTYCLGKVDGNIKPLNNNRATAFVYFPADCDGWVDHIGLAPAVLLWGAGNHPGQFGLGIMNGQFGQNANDRNVGTIQWYDEETLEYIQGDTTVTVDDINPSAMNNLPVIA